MFEVNDLPQQEEDMKKTPEVAEVATANNRFGLNLYDNVKKERNNKDHHKIMNPVSCFCFGWITTLLLWKVTYQINILANN